MESVWSSLSDDFMEHTKKHKKVECFKFEILQSENFMWKITYSKPQ